MDVSEVAPGLWRWTVRHPEWTPDQGGPDGWDPDVSAVYCETGGTLMLIDPIIPAGEGERERFWRALDRDVERVGAPRILLTCPWHARSSGAVLERYPGVQLWVHAEGAVELARVGAPGDRRVSLRRRATGGIAAIDAVAPMGEVLYWLPSHAALVCGDALIGGGPFGVRVCPDSWHDDTDPGSVRAALRAGLGELPVQRVLVSHGAPGARGWP